MELLYNVLSTASRFLIAGSAGSLIQYMVELSSADKPEHPGWLIGAAIGFSLSCAAFTLEEKAKPPSKLHPDSIRELRDAQAADNGRGYVRAA